MLHPVKLFSGCIFKQDASRQKIDKRQYAQLQASFARVLLKVAALGDCKHDGFGVEKHGHQRQ
jgi:hypothetical protein